MNLQVDRVKTGYANLSLSEREEVKKFIEKIDKSGWIEDKQLREQLRNETKFMLGPTGAIDASRCLCCGK